MGWDRGCPAWHPEAPSRRAAGRGRRLRIRPSHLIPGLPPSSNILRPAGLIPPSSWACLAVPSRWLLKASQAVCFWVSAYLRMLSRSSSSCTPRGGCWLVPGPGARHRTLALARLNEKFTLLLLKLPPLSCFSLCGVGRVVVTSFAGF